MPDPGATSNWRDLILAVLGAVGLREVVARLLTLRQERRKGDAEARGLEIAAEGSLFARADAELERMSARIKYLEEQRDLLETRLREERDRMEERLRIAEDEIVELRRQVREMGGIPRYERAPPGSAVS